MPTLAGINRAAPELIAATRTFVSRRLDCLPTVRLSRVVTRVARRAHVPSRASMRDFGTASRVSRPARGVAGAKPSGSGAPGHGVESTHFSRRASGAPASPPSSRDASSATHSSALRMAKERAALAEKRAKMAQDRAAELERAVRDGAAHVELLQEELAHYAKVASAHPPPPRPPTSNAAGFAASTASRNSAAHATAAERDSAVKQLAERLRRAELQAEKRTAALEERLRAQTQRAARAEARAAAAEAAAKPDNESASSASASSNKSSAPHLSRRLMELEERLARLRRVHEGLCGFVLTRERAADPRVCHGVVDDGGDAYEGFMRASAPELFGACVYACGDEYVGEWADGQPHGRGTCRFKKGNAYAGGWANGGYHGDGVYTYADGGSFEGKWVDDKRHGPGVFRDAEGDVHDEVYDMGELKSRNRRAEAGRGKKNESREEGRNGGGGEKPGEASGRAGGSPRAGARSSRSSDGSGSSSGSGGSGSSGDAVGAAEMRAIREELRKRYDARWRAFESRPARAPIDHADIPWPPVGMSLLAAEHGGAGGDAMRAEMRRRYKSETMRWHPDKWQGKALAPHSREKIMADVTNVFRRVDGEKQRAGL